MDLHARLRHQLEGFRDCLRDDLTAPIEHCPGWTLYDLADHLGNGNLWVASAVRDGRDGHHPVPAPRDALVPWFEDTCAVMLEALAADLSAPAWTFHPPHTIGFWQRRRCQETLLHRWDAENALNRPTAIDADLAEDGIAEVFDTMAPRQIVRGRTSEPEVAIRVRAHDSGGSWIYGPGEPVAEITGTAEQLLLMLWGRLSVDHPAIGWTGDRKAALVVLAGPLTP
ncbi:maleylpyruvate isomerase family mycothiol-dependent enzyme [Plantactinospora sp. ZYX-F-223]|uniref:maleylpyruvate isomerase family mycothiol-dependent enzyme n=1 Tax=Plantactinospora sp. ZYX-F-223 TaxID=3144103 RepID=UPI0031FBF5BE